MASTSDPSGRTRPRPERGRSPHREPPATCHPGCGPSRPRAARFAPSWARPFRSGPRLLHDTVAITPIVGTLVILGISTVGIAAVMTWGIPNVQQSQNVAEFEGVLNQFYALDQIADGVMRGGSVGKASEGTISIPQGQIERSNGTLFVVTWYPNTQGRDDRFWFEGIGDDTPQTFSLYAEDAVVAENDYVLVERVYSGTHTPLAADGGRINGITTSSAKIGSANPLQIDLGDRDLEDRPTRIRVVEFGGTDAEGPYLMEAWILPSGSLAYTRNTAFGLAGLRLENGAVISEMETGDFLRSQPLGTIETNAAGEPTFVGLFHMLFVDDPKRPGVQAAGIGSFPIKFSLQENNLRADGLAVEAVHVDAIGPRAHLWERHHMEAMDFVRVSEAVPPLLDHPRAGETPGPPGVWLEAPIPDPLEPDLRQPFDLVVLESLIGVSLQVQIADLGAGV